MATERRRCHPEAERKVLGACMLATHALDVVEAQLTPASFYVPAHAVVFDAIRAVRAAQQPVDVVTVAAELRTRDRLTTIGGEAFLGELTDLTATAAHVEHWARLVADAAVVREVADAARTVATMEQSGASLDEVVERAGAVLLAATERRRVAAPVPLEDALGEAFARIEAAERRPDGVVGVPTGFDAFDRATSGLQAGQLVILAARPRVGKTAWMVNAALHAAAKGHRTLVFSLEMMRLELTQRMLAAESGVDHGRIRANILSGDDMSRLTAAAQATFALPMLIDDVGETTITELRAKARAAKRAGGLGLVCVDYLQLIRQARGVKHGSRQEEVAEHSRALKALAKELGCPVLALAQMNRNVEQRGASARPRLSDLRESGQIEQDADVIAFLDRPELDSPKDPALRGRATLVLAKQRGGPIGDFALRYVHELTKFVEVADGATEERPDADW